MIVFTEPQAELLRDIILHGAYVDESTLLSMADLVRDGLARVENEYEGLHAEATSKGVTAALESGIVTQEDISCFPRMARGHQ